MNRRKVAVRNQKILRRIMAGERYVDIAASFDLSAGHISQIATRNGLGRGRGHGRGGKVVHKPDFVAKARKLWDQGNSMRAVARKCGVSLGVMAGIVYRNDFTARPSPIKRAA